MTKKDIIKNYIINLIIGQQIKIGEKIPTEKELQNTFKISRQPVRNALRELCYSDWIFPKWGSGYFVSSYGNYESLFIKGKYKIWSTTIRELSKNEEAILDIFNFKAFSIKSRFFVKEYFNKEGELMIKTINVIDKDYLLGISDEEIKRGTIQALLAKNIKISHQINEIDFYTLTKDSFMGWNNNMPIIKSTLFIDNRVLERTIIFLRKEIFNFRKKTFF